MSLSATAARHLFGPAYALPTAPSRNQMVGTHSTASLEFGQQVGRSECVPTKKFTRFGKNLTDNLRDNRLLLRTAFGS